MVALSYTVNLLVLVPLLAAFALQPHHMEAVFGPPTDARRILICLYVTIALASIVGLLLLGSGNAALAAQIGITLFSLQIAYKLMTVFAVGLSSPVVITNLIVAAFHCATLFTLWRA